MEQNHFSKTGRGSSKEHSGEIILKLAHWPERRCRLKGFSIFSSDGHFVQGYSSKVYHPGGDGILKKF